MNCVEWVFRASAAAGSWGVCANVNECAMTHSDRNCEFRDELGRLVHGLAVGGGVVGADIACGRVAQI